MNTQTREDIEKKKEQTTNEMRTDKNTIEILQKMILAKPDIHI